MISRKECIGFPIFSIIEAMICVERSVKINLSDLFTALLYVRSFKIPLNFISFHLYCSRFRDIFVASEEHYLLWLMLSWLLSETMQIIKGEEVFLFTLFRNM